jgi:hypothetical protein
MGPASRTPTLIAVGLLIGVLLGFLGERLLERAGGRPEPAVGVAPEGAGRGFPSRGEVDALYQGLAAEVEARSILADEVDRLRQELSRLSGTAEDLGAEGDSISGPEEAPQGAVEREGSPQGAGGSRAAGGPGAPVPPRFDEAALVAAGLDPTDAARLRDRWMRFETDKLNLTYQATREGWLMSPRYRQELQDLDRGLRQELGDRDYEGMLYATGEPNRLVAREVLDGSMASEAGIVVGDIILGYDGIRLFRPTELLLATAAGEPGEQVRLEIVREGEPLSLYVRRGPLGVMLESVSEPPLPN